MIRAISQKEALPDSYPAIDGVTGEALAVAWQRVEHYTAYRYSPRQVVWRLDAEAGEWLAPLAPIVAITAQQGDGAPYEPESGPMGGYLIESGCTVLTATVGAEPVPVAVAQAVQRLARYLAVSDAIPPGVTRFGSGTFNASVRREDISPAMAMVNSGAADLLRAYRRI